MFALLFKSGFSFVRHIAGIVVTPYETYRDIEKRGHVGEIIYIGLLVGAYFFFSSIVKIASFHPLLLSKYALVLFIAALSGYGAIVSLLFVIARYMKLPVRIERVCLLWGYTLVPTLVWFFFTSCLYVAFPPPRTTAVTGVVLSIVYLVVSAMIFWWKLTLSYLTLRFGLKIDFGKIVVVVLVFIPILALWTYTMYVLGVYKVPFL